MYKLLYTAETRDIKETPLKIEIYKDTEDNVTAKELNLGGDEPIVIEYDAGGDIFKTLIQSTCTIKVVTNEPLLNLYTGKLNEICIKVYKNNQLFWYGFLTPNVYSQEYEAGANEFDLEFIDLIAHLENIKFVKVGFYKSFYQYINNAIDLVDKLGVITGIVNHEDIAINLKTMGVLERNFIDETADEEDGAMTYKEMLESLVGWMGKSMIQWGDKIYIVDLSMIQFSNFGLYDRATAEKSLYTMDTNVKDIKHIISNGNIIGDIGVNDASCSISLGDVYNKVTVVANTNEIDNIMPNIMDESKKKSIMSAGLDYTTTTVVSRRALQDGETDADRTFKRLNAFFVNPDWGMPYGSGTAIEHATTYPTGTTTNIQDDHVNTPQINVTTMTWWVGNVDTLISLVFYDLLGGVYSEYDKDDNGYWVVNVPKKDGVNMAGQPWVDTEILGGWHDPVISWNILYSSGGNEINNSNVDKVAAVTCIQKYADWCVADGDPSSIDWKTVLTLARTEWDLDLNNIWTGTLGYRGNKEPDTYVKLINKPSFIGMGGYFILSMSYILSNNYCFANIAPCNFTSETYGTCLEYASTTTDCTYRDDKFKCELMIGNYAFNGTDWVYVSSTATTPSFYIMHKNKKGDRIFGVSKSIDNTVSYSWNLASSQDGFAIPLPTDKVLSGELSFKLYADSRLGGAAQVNNGGFLIPHHGDADTNYGWGNFDGYLQNCSPILAIHIDKLELIYTTKDTVSDVYNLEEYDPDIKYTNVVNSDYVTELDDIELTTNTYTPHAVSFSYVINKNGNIYSYVTEINGLKQEERILQKYVNFYKNPKLKYTNNLDADLITPFRRIHVNSLDKYMIPIGLSYNLKDNRVNTQLTEY